RRHRSVAAVPDACLRLDRHDRRLAAKALVGAAARRHARDLRRVLGVALRGADEHLVLAVYRAGRRGRRVALLDTGSLRRRDDRAIRALLPRYLARIRCVPGYRQHRPGAGPWPADPATAGTLPRPVLVGAMGEGLNALH